MYVCVYNPVNVCLCVIPIAVFFRVCVGHYLSRRLLPEPFSVSQCSWIWFTRHAVKVLLTCILRPKLCACVCVTCLLKVLCRPPERVMECSGRYWGSLSYRWTHSINICTGLGSDKSVGWTHHTHTFSGTHRDKVITGSQKSWFIVKSLTWISLTNQD